MWHDIWHLQVSVGEKVLRAALVYGFLIVALRISGKRALGGASAIDLLVMVLVANAVQNGIIGNDNSVTGAFIGAGVIFALDRTLGYATYRSGRLDGVLNGTPTVLISDGHPIPRALAHEEISLLELEVVARRQGFTSLREVDRATLETNGMISMFRPAERPMGEAIS
jgi:uncharacterized membrane protein YcaP (DUF421 family)